MRYIHRQINAPINSLMYARHTIYVHQILDQIHQPVHVFDNTITRKRNARQKSEISYEAPYSKNVDL